MAKTIDDLIVDAMKEGNPDKVKAAMDAHMAKVKKYMMEGL